RRQGPRDPGRSRSRVGRSSKCSSAESAAAADSGPPPASAITSPIRSAITRDRAPSRFAAWSSPPPRASAELVVKAVRAARLPGTHRGTGPLQPGQVTAARARDDPPRGTRLAAVEAAVGDHDAGAGTPVDLPGERLHPGVLGRAVLPA